MSAWHNIPGIGRKAKENIVNGFVGEMMSSAPPVSSP
jgi:hypothetical protein